MARIITIIPAAGQGKRMKAEKNKQFLHLQGMPIIAHTLLAFERCKSVDEIILVAAPGEENLFMNEIISVHDFKKVSHVVSGGKERQDSVSNGFTAIKGNVDIVMIHDGARPLITEDIINNAVENAWEYGAAVVAVPVKDTIKEVGEEGLVQKTLDRKTLWQAQTPQAFRYEVLAEALKKSKEKGFVGTDDTSLVEAIGGKVKVVQGSYENVKVTTPEDLILAESILKRRVT